MIGATSMRQQWPNAEEHEDLCRVLMFRWRLVYPRLSDAVDKFPCSCAARRPWKLVEIDHPPWCVLGEDPHPWHQCTITRMVPVDKKE